MAEDKPNNQLASAGSFPEFIQPTEHFLVSQLRTPHAIHAQIAELVSAVEYQDLHHVELSVAAPNLHGNKTTNANRVQYHDFKPTVREAYLYFAELSLEWMLVEFGVFSSSYVVSKRSGQNFKGRINDYFIFQYIFGAATLADV